MQASKFQQNYRTKTELKIINIQNLQLFGNQATWSLKGESEFRVYVQQLGLDTAQFNACMKSGIFGARAEADMNEGRSIGVTGTPTFLINGKPLVGAQPYSAFQSIIESELAK